ncbi:hypothetical protein HN865_04300 [Candidatus Woesearchaeota archaeon]|jgi:hypothetical protein|nr:hypothetical protein [Candidatus Woesearchaeota archaeon]MBT6995328.1 hypothetical protein [Candidatus Woesearchaeota archaeon]MBT7238049.1 hypothetical protein [Candidatus Woesearchaeota archaeon]
MTIEYKLNFLKAESGMHTISRKEFIEDIKLFGGMQYLVTETITDNNSELLKQAKANAERFVAEFAPDNYSILLNI